MYALFGIVHVALPHALTLAFTHTHTHTLTGSGQTGDEDQCDAGFHQVFHGLFLCSFRARFTV